MIQSAYAAVANVLRGGGSSEGASDIQHDDSDARSDPTHASTSSRSLRSRPMSSPSRTRASYLGSSVQELPVGRYPVVVIPRQPVNPLKELGDIVHV